MDSSLLLLSGSSLQQCLSCGLCSVGNIGVLSSVVHSLAQQHSGVLDSHGQCAWRRNSAVARYACTCFKPAVSRYACTCFTDLLHLNYSSEQPLASNSAQKLSLWVHAQYTLTVERECKLDKSNKGPPTAVTFREPCWFLRFDGSSLCSLGGLDTYGGCNRLIATALQRFNASKEIPLHSPAVPPTCNTCVPPWPGTGDIGQLPRRELRFQWLFVGSTKAELSPAQQQVVCVDRGYWRLVLTLRSDVVSGITAEASHATSLPTQQPCSRCSRWAALHGSAPA
jgi:hypothetical protein